MSDLWGLHIAADDQRYYQELDPRNYDEESYPDIVRARTLLNIQPKHFDMPSEEALGYGWSHDTVNNHDPNQWSEFDGFNDHVRDHGIKRPLDIVTDGKSAYLEDGHHRAQMAAELGHSHVPVRVTKGQVPPHKAQPIGESLRSWISGSTDGIRYAMPWKDWAPHIQGGCDDGCEHTPKSDVNYGEYYIDHPDGSGKQVGDIMPGLNGRSLVQFYHDIGPGGEPEIYISGIHADSNHRHDGVAEALVRRLHEDHPGVRINPGFMTDDGLAFRNRMLEKEPNAKSVLAAVTQNLVHRLHDEFHEWWDKNGKEPENWYGEGGEDEDGNYADPNSYAVRGPIGHWPNIESFLKDRYPAAHKNLEFGDEEATSGLDGRWVDDEYETGPEAEAKHGYDPKEIAAAMLLLHNESHPFRGDLSEIDQKRLNDIAQKRFKMQRDYEQRTAMGQRGPLPENLTFKYWPEEAYLTPEHVAVGSIDLPAVTAHIGDDPEPVGHLSWIPGHPDDYRREMLENHDEGTTIDDIAMSGFGQPIGSHPGDQDYIGWPTTISNISVADEWQRHGIADAMFDYAKNHHYPELRHSFDLTPDGAAWSEHEQNRRRDVLAAAAIGEDLYDVQQNAMLDALAMHHYIENGEHPNIGGFAPGKTVAHYPAAHHPLLTNHWAAESLHPDPVSGPFGNRVQSAALRYVENLTDVAENGPGGHGGAGDKLDFARNGLRVELQHGGHFRVPNLASFSGLPRPNDASKLKAVNPRFAFGIEGPNEAHAEAHQVNCQRSCLALDARHRGYNVEAERNYYDPIKDPQGSDEQWGDEDLAAFWRDKDNYPTQWIDAEDHFGLTAPGPKHWDLMHEHIAGWGPGARGLVAMTSLDPAPEAGKPPMPFRHVIMAHVGRNSHVRFVDPQSALEDASHWRDRIVYGGHPLLYSTEERNRVDSVSSDPLFRLMFRNRFYSPLRFTRIDDKTLHGSAAKHLIDRGTAGPVPIYPLYD